MVIIPSDIAKNYIIMNSTFIQCSIKNSEE